MKSERLTLKPYDMMIIIDLMDSMDLFNFHIYYAIPYTCTACLFIQTKVVVMFIVVKSYLYRLKYKLMYTVYITGFLSKVGRDVI